MIDHQTIELNIECSSLNWVGDRLIDWTSDRVYFDPNNEGKFFNKYSFGDRFDGVKSVRNGEYIVIYEKLGTKGLVLKEGELVREINRSYYCSDAYEFPIELDSNNDALIIHCPEQYNKLEIEHLETGERLSNESEKDFEDIFYSRLQVSPNKQFLLNAGWVWHPFDVLTIVDLDKFRSDPSTLNQVDAISCISSEVSSARFLLDSRILVSTSLEDPLTDRDNQLPPNHVGIYNPVNQKIESKFELDEPFGNLWPINDEMAWDFFQYPKIIDIKKGIILALSLIHI